MQKRIKDLNKLSRILENYCLVRDNYTCQLSDVRHSKDDLVVYPFYDEKHLSIRFDVRNYLCIYRPLVEDLTIGKFGRIIHTKAMIKKFTQKEFVLFVALANHYTSKIDCYVTNKKIEQDIEFLENYYSENF